MFGHAGQVWAREVTLGMFGHAGHVWAREGTLGMFGHMEAHLGTWGHEWACMWFRVNVPDPHTHWFVMFSVWARFLVTWGGGGHVWARGGALDMFGHAGHVWAREGMLGMSGHVWAHGGTFGHVGT